jgi:hypothetical protein
VSVYSTGAESYRDTTKWLVALVPVASLVAAAAVVGPRLVTGKTAAGSWSAWITTYWPALLGCGLVLVGIGLTVAKGAKVLSTEPKGYGEILADGARLNKAFGAGAGFPYFLKSDDFKDAVLDLNDAPPSDQAAQTVRAAANERAVAASTQLLEWSFFDALRAEFGAFKIRFLLGIVLIAAGLALAIVAVDLAPAPIVQPTAAVVRLSSPGATALIRSTGCQAPSTTRFVAVSGTWSSPVLETEGPGCRVNAQWRPSSSQAQVLPASASPSGVSFPPCRARWNCQPENRQPAAHHRRRCSCRGWRCHEGDDAR